MLKRTGTGGTGGDSRGKERTVEQNRVYQRRVQSIKSNQKSLFNLRWEKTPEEDRRGRERTDQR